MTLILGGRTCVRVPGQRGRWWAAGIYLYAKLPTAAQQE